MESSIKLLQTGFLQVNTLIVPCADGRYFVTDPGGDAEEIAAVFDDLKSEPRAVILTHGHFDHIAGLKELTSLFPGLPVVIHRADAVYLGANCAKYHAADFALMNMADYIAECAAGTPEATKTVSDSDVLFGWKVIHTPGHSPGSICLYSAEQQTLVSGDTLFKSGYGRTDLYGGSDAALSASLKILSALPPETKVYPGHGPDTTVGREFPRRLF